MRACWAAGKLAIALKRNTWTIGLLGILARLLIFTKLEQFQYSEATALALVMLLGSFAVLLLWICYTALICFFGAEFTQVFARRHGSLIEPEQFAERVGEKPDTVEE